ncbi:MAG: metallophosphoesterase [Phycisphaerae bacterium]|nr:metallophosphoesterase [Phycisphaerae bacterium]
MPSISDGYTLVARIAHVTDTHIVDEESPARFPGAQEIVPPAWRPYEAYSTQLLDGILRTVNRIHASGRTTDFLVHTGDACDNSQLNELAWFLGVFDGQAIDPLTGPDDRPAEARPDPLMDPHAAFTAQGLYEKGIHGDRPSIPWYTIVGNHDVFAIGVFAIFEDVWGRRVAPLPLPRRPGLLLPAVLDPLAWFSHAHVTPGNPGPPCLLDFPQFVEPNPDRRFFNRRELVHAMFSTVTGPAGHGFTDPETGPSWYSVAPVPGLRLIGLDTCQPTHQIGGFPYQDGSISAEQVAFLRTELDAARDRDELVIVASHHPSASLWTGYGSALAGSTFRALLNEYPNVVLHLAGHNHRNRVMDRDGYIEIETCSTLDSPQEARLVEIWRHDTDGTVVIAYEMFSHLDDELPPLGSDPLRALRAAAQAIAMKNAGAMLRQDDVEPSGTDARGSPTDRNGLCQVRHNF